MEELLANIQEWQEIIIVSLLLLTNVAAIIFGLMKKKEWKAKADSAGEELVELNKQLTGLSQATSGIILGIENMKKKLPEVHAGRMNGLISEVTNDYGVEELVKPMVAEVQKANAILSDLAKLVS